MDKRNFKSHMTPYAFTVVYVPRCVFINYMVAALHNWWENILFTFTIVIQYVPGMD